MREEGYYWVKISDDFDWEAAYYDSKYKEWVLVKSQYLISNDEELQEIDEKRIVR